MPNKRFGVMRGVCSRKVLWEFASLSPVRAFVFPARTPSRQPLGAMLGDSEVEKFPFDSDLEKSKSAKLGQRKSY